MNKKPDNNIIDLRLKNPAVIFSIVFSLSILTMPISSWAKEYPSDIVSQSLDQVEEQIYHDWKAKLDLSAGYRIDKLKWNIAGNSSGTSPNILSELTWEDTEIYQVRGKAGLSWKSYLVEGSAGYGKIFDGKNQDSDYLADNRTLEFSRSNNGVDGDDVLDLSGGVGYQIELKNRETRASWGVNHLSITPLLGYSYHQQNLHIIDGFQTIPATGSFGGLHSTYETEWKGPWFGLELAGERKKMTGYLRMEYHIADYYAKANWNLRSDFKHPKSFEHTADGYGLIFGFGTGYKLNDRWAINLNGDIQNWRADDGIDRTFFSNGTSAETRFNEVEWDSFSAMLGMSYFLE